MPPKDPEKLAEFRLQAKIHQLLLQAGSKGVCRKKEIEMIKLNSDDNRSYCFTHKLDYESTDEFIACPKCKEVRQKDLCASCEVHKASVDFAESTMEALRGWKKRICKCCYFKIVEEAVKNTTANYEKLKKELSETQCT